MSAIQRLRQHTNQELKLNTDSNDHETQTKIIASFAAIDISNLTSKSLSKTIQPETSASIFGKSQYVLS